MAYCLSPRPIAGASSPEIPLWLHLWCRGVAYLRISSICQNSSQSQVAAFCFLQDKRSSASAVSMLKLVKPFKNRIPNIYNRIFKAIEATISHSHTMKHASYKEQRWYLAKSALFGIILEPADPKFGVQLCPGKELRGRTNGMNKWRPDRER